MHETSEHMHAAMQRQAAGFVWIRLGTAGSVLLAMLERAACMLQHGELGRPFTSSRQLGPAGSRWVGQLSWVGPVGFHSRTTLSESNTLAHRQLLLGRSGLLKSPQSSARPILENCGCADAVSSDVGRCRGVTGCGDSGRKHRRYCGPHVHLGGIREVSGTHRSLQATWPRRTRGEGPTKKTRAGGAGRSLQRRGAHVPLCAWQGLEKHLRAACALPGRPAQRLACGAGSPVCDGGRR
jgi:hypothetical protein